ncbi:hypothetical protein LCGC14_2982270 [marine sediment metagenome]|uniref:Uncharacterized protein n=1 Tax=marine sediment metagenome TaxID=412755 RepID=A0A0F8ZXH2_9ZZZZ
MNYGDKLVLTYHIQKEYDIYKPDRYYWIGYLLSDKIIEFKILLAVKSVFIICRN